MRRTVLLTERRSRPVRLTSADVAFLLAAHRGRIDLAPTGRRGVYQLTPRGCAGVIAAPTRRLVIRPKIPLKNLFFLLDASDVAAVAPDEAAPAAGVEILDFLAGLLARLLAERAAAGLRRGYREQAENGPFLHGRIDVPAQLREGPGRQHRLHGLRDDFTLDIPCNQAPRATAERLLASSLLGGARAALHNAMHGFDEVQAAPLTPELFAAAEADPQADSYRPLLHLCRLLADSLAPGDAAGAASCPAFLLDMERVFERYVSRGVVDAFAGAEGWTAAMQQPHVAAKGLELRPDITLHRGGRPTLVVDAKWKRIAGGPARPDLYQMLAYCTGLGAGRAVLVYPGRRDCVRRFPLLNAPVCVEMRTLRVVGDRAECRQSMKRLGRGLRCV